MTEAGAAPGEDARREALGREADHFHARLFGAPPPEAVRARYVAANGRLFGDADPAAAALVRAVVERGCDVEAVEYALRLRGGPHLLTRKLEVLLALVEVRAAYRPLFVNGRPGLLRGAARLAAAAARSAWLYAKGRWLLARHGLV